MPTPAAIAPVGTCSRVIFGSHEVFTSWSAMTASAENADIVYEIRFFHLQRSAKIVCQILSASNGSGENKADLNI